MRSTEPRPSERGGPNASFRSLLVFFAFVLLPPMASGELRVLIVEPNGSERPLLSFEEVSSVSMGEAVDVLVRLRNDATSPLLLERLTIAGAAFSIANPPALPRIVSSGGLVNFNIRFAPAAAGSYGASLNVNNASYILRATATPALRVSIVRDGVPQLLASGASIDFGAVESGSTAIRNFTIDNLATVRLPLSVETSSDAFSAITDGLPRDLAPGESASLEILYRAGEPGPATGTLRVGARRFNLQAMSTEPPIPQLSISIEPGVLRSAQQAAASISLEGPAKMRLTGELTLAFVSDVPDLPDDGTVQFAGGGRSVAFEVAAGGSTALFGPEAAVGFQTGTTAGTLVVRARIRNTTEERRYAIPHSAVIMRALHATRTGSSLSIRLSGFDNTRTASQISFTFFDSAGVSIQQPLRVDAGEGFRSYFRTSAAGGAFSLGAVFPLTGNPLQIGPIEVEILNSAGRSTSERFRIEP